MSVLAIDTSSRARTVCLRCTPGGAVEEEAAAAGEPFGAALPRLLGRVLAPDAEAIVVVTGPGSYSGLRAGMAAALGVAHARGVPVHGVGTLLLVAQGWDAAPGTRGTVAVDAGRGGAYAAACARADPAWEVQPAQRVDITALQHAGVVASPDPLDIAGLLRVDPLQALARAVPIALRGAPLPLDGMAAAYAESG